MARQDLSGVVDRQKKTRQRKKLQEPPMFNVILHNDDYTTMEFVVQVLVEIFRKQAAEATRIMLDVHKKGRGVCGSYPYDIAVSKVAQVQEMARRHSFPLKCSWEKC